MGCVNVPAAGDSQWIEQQPVLSRTAATRRPAVLLESRSFLGGLLVCFASAGLPRRAGQARPGGVRLSLNEGYFHLMATYQDQIYKYDGPAVLYAHTKLSPICIQYAYNKTR